MKNHSKTFTQVSKQKSKRKMIEQGLHVVAGVDLGDGAAGTPVHVWGCGRSGAIRASARRI